MARALIRIDKNGTKYWADDTCRRCGGAGERSEWYYTGLVCFECGGTGRVTPRIEKEYTDEYAAVLKERRLTREARKLGYASAEDMRKARIEEAKREAEEKQLEDARREAEEKRLNEIREKASRNEDEYKALSEAVGVPGQKITLEAVYIGSPHFERKAFTGYGMETVYIHTFKNERGDKLVWKTGSGLALEEGSTVELTGTVKEHSEYRGEMQTILSRCKVKYLRTMAKDWEEAQDRKGVPVIWEVDHGNGCGWQIYHNLFATEEEARAYFETIPEKWFREIYKVRDIWGWLEKHNKTLEARA